MLLSAVLLQPIFFVLVAHYQRLPVEWLLWGLGLSITVGMSVSLVAGIFLLIEFLMRRFWPTKRS